MSYTCALNLQLASPGFVPQELHLLLCRCACDGSGVMIDLHTACGANIVVPSLACRACHYKAGVAVLRTVLGSLANRKGE